MVIIDTIEKEAKFKTPLMLGLAASNASLLNSIELCSRREQPLITLQTNNIKGVRPYAANLHFERKQKIEKLNNKKGQATVFIILGIAILIGIILILYLRPIGETAERRIFLDEAGQIGITVENYVQTCLEKTSENALIYIGKHGGYYNLPQTTDSLFLLPYYFYAGESKTPSKEEVENQLSLYVNNELFFCLKGFYDFYSQGIQVRTGEANTTARISENEVSFNVNLPVYIKKGEVSKNLERFSASIPSRLNTIFNVADNFIKEQENIPDSACLSCIMNLGQENNLKIEAAFVREGEMIFKIIDEKVLVKEALYEFSFMNKYDFRENKEEK